MSMCNDSKDTTFFAFSYKFLESYLIKQIRRSQNTKKQYKLGLSSLFDYLVETEIEPDTFLISSCDYEFVLSYSEHLQQQGAKPATVNARITAIKRYLGYVAGEDVTFMQQYLSVKRIPALTVEKKIRPVIKKESLKDFLDLPRNTLFGNRDRFMLILLFDSAIRAEELTKIVIGDIDISNEETIIQIHGKGRKERQITLSANATAHLNAYLKSYHFGNTDKNRPLFYTKAHGIETEMSVRNVERIVSKYGKEAATQGIEIPSSVYPHMLRRTRGTHMVQDGIPIETVSEFLGHSLVQTTRDHYASVSLEQKREASERGTQREPGVIPEWKNRVADLKKKYGLK